MKKLGFILVLFLISFATFSQKNDSKNRPPWVNGSLPSNSATYNYKVVQGDGNNLSDAKNNAVEALIVDLGSEQGVTVSSETILKTQTLEKGNDQTFTADYTTNSKIIQDDFIAVFSRVDEYYETMSDISGNRFYRVWRLYGIGPKSKSIPEIAYSNKYSFQDAGFRSLIIPGWGQFYKKTNGKGIIFATAAVASIGTFIYADNEHAYNINRSNETSNLDLKKAFAARAGDYTTIKNLCLGAAAVTWVLGTIDAISTEGTLKYDNSSLRLGLAPSMDKYINLSINYNF